MTPRAATYLLAIIGALTAQPAQADPAVVKDADGRDITVTDASRIVSVGGAVTEILYALGKEASIVGIDTTSLYPHRAAKEKPSVGYMRQLSAEGVLGLRPSVIMAIEGSGPKDTMAVLKEARVPLVVVPDNFSIHSIEKKIAIIAQATDAADRGRCLIEQVRADIAALEKLKAGIHKKKRVMFVLSFVNGRAMVSGRNTAADGIIGIAGAENAITGYEGYKPISDEAVIAARPDVVLAMERGGPGAVNADVVFAHPAFSVTPAAAARGFIAMDGLYLLGFGPRTARAARDLAVALYPDLRPAASQDKTDGVARCRE